MASQIASLLKHGWENLWKNRILWLFSFLVLVEPLIRLIIPISHGADLPASFSNLITSLLAYCLRVLSLAGVAFVAYRIAIGSPVDFQTAFQVSKKLFWRIIGLSFLVLVLLIPYICIVAFSLRLVLQGDNRYNFVFIPVLLSVFTAMWYFPITEMIANDSKMIESLKTAWTVFIRNIVSLAITGLLLIILLRMMGTFIGMVMILVQNAFDVSALDKLDFIAPHLSFPNNNFYDLVTAIPQTIWQTYSVSIFTLAYLKYSGATMTKDRSGQSKGTA